MGNYAPSASSASTIELAHASRDRARRLSHFPRELRARATLGFFLTAEVASERLGPATSSHWPLAIQEYSLGSRQPIAGRDRDRYGTLRVLCAGGTLYALGLVLMAYSTRPGCSILRPACSSASGCRAATFSVVLAAFGKLLPESWRFLAFGAGTAAGSFGQSSTRRSPCR